ncbi:MAG: DUF1934 domain-containing protein [Clostridia bacterium]|nr:DUF1934 domain-containing protein [Clostridia bacterium]
MKNTTSVWITLNNHITMDGQSDTVGIEVAGTCVYKDGADVYLPSYKEQDTDGTVTDVSVLLGADHGAVSRKGPVNSFMKLTAGKRETCTFETPMGNLLADVELLSCSREQQRDGFRWELHYHMYFGPGEPADHHMIITAKPI